MFVLKGKNGETLTSCEQHSLDQEITFNSFEEAEQMLSILNSCMPKNYFEIKEK